MVKLGGTFYTPFGGNRKIYSSQEIVNYADKLQVKKIILVGSKANGTNMYSVKYLKHLMSVLSKEIPCEWFYSYSPDEDFAFISKAYHVFDGLGGFVKYAKLISEYRL